MSAWRCAAAALGAAAVLGAAAAAAAGDPMRGEQLFQRCFSCHSVEPGENDLTGPNLRGVVGRRAGTLAGFEYSDAFLEAARLRSLVWDEATLDRWLADPLAFIPGTQMSPVGLKDATDRADVIAYLRQVTP